jgi:hypothetical protein
VAFNYETLYGVISDQAKKVDDVCPDAGWKVTAMVAVSFFPLISRAVALDEGDSQMALREKISGRQAEELEVQDDQGWALTGALDFLQGINPDGTILFSDAYAYREKAHRSPAVCQKEMTALAKLNKINEVWLNHLEAGDPNDWENTTFRIPSADSHDLEKEVQAIIQRDPVHALESKSGN